MRLIPRAELRSERILSRRGRAPPCVRRGHALLLKIQRKYSKRCSRPRAGIRLPRPFAARRTGWPASPTRFPPAVEHRFATVPSLDHQPRGTSSEPIGTKYVKNTVCKTRQPVAMPQIIDEFREL